LREKHETLLASTSELNIDLSFSGTKSTTPSFIDELVGVLVLRHGPDIVWRLIFKGCAESIKDIWSFVVVSRTDDFLTKNQH